MNLKNNKMKKTILAFSISILTFVSSFAQDEIHPFGSIHLIQKTTK